MIVRLARGSETIPLSGDGAAIVGCKYVPRAPGRDATDVSETVEVVFAGAAEAVQAQAHEIDSWLELARLRQETHLSDRVFVEAQMSPGDDFYRSELLDGRAEWPDDAALALRGQVLTLPVFWTRRPYWEGPETGIPLTNANGADVTVGLPVYNANDGAGTAPNKRTNWVKVLGDDIAGDLPAACRIEITRTYADADGDGTFYIGQAVLPAVGEDVYVLEAEDATGETTENDAGASGGAYKQIALSGSAEQDTITWDLDGAALLDVLGDNWFLLLGRFFTLPTGKTLTRFEVRSGSARVGGQVNQTVLLTTQLLQNLGLIRLSPVFLGAPRADLDLILLGQKEGGGGFDLDFIQTTPLDGYRELVPVGAAGLANGETLVDDMLADPPLVYVLASGKRRPGYANHARGDKSILLRPGYDQVITFLWNDTAGGAEIARRAEVKLYYRPRRRLP